MCTERIALFVWFRVDLSGKLMGASVFNCDRQISQHHELTEEIPSLYRRICVPNNAEATYLQMAQLHYLINPIKE